MDFARRQVEAHPDIYADAHLRFVVHPLLDDLVREDRPAIHAALVGVLLLLFTTVVNATSILTGFGAFLSQRFSHGN